MRLNKYIAARTEYSRRAADHLIAEGRVLVNGEVPSAGLDVSEDDRVTIDGAPLRPVTEKAITLVLHKPRGYVCSRNGQGSKTIYDILPAEYSRLNPVGRLDKDTSGLLLMTTDGDLANSLTHPRYQKVKVYEVSLDQPLQPLHQQMISDIGVTLEDGPSRFMIEKTDDTSKHLKATLTEGRNRQIRRTFASLGYSIERLHRTDFGPYSLGDLPEGAITIL